MASGSDYGASGEIWHPRDSPRRQSKDGSEYLRSHWSSGSYREVALITFAAVTISVCASAAPADYDGKWYLSGDCSALTIPPFDPAFHYEWLTTIQGGAFSELKIGLNVRGVRTEERWSAHVEGSNVNIVTDGSSAKGGQWRRQYIGRADSPTLITFNGGLFVPQAGGGSQARTCSGTLTSIVPDPTSLAALAARTTEVASKRPSETETRAKAKQQTAAVTRRTVTSQKVPQQTHPQSDLVASTQQQTATTPSLTPNPPVATAAAKRQTAAEARPEAPSEAAQQQAHSLPEPASHVTGAVATADCNRSIGGTRCAKD